MNRLRGHLIDYYLTEITQMYLRAIKKVTLLFGHPVNQINVWIYTERITTWTVLGEYFWEPHYWTPIGITK